MQLISVIIPCHNSEKYIEECLVSIMNQTYKNLEIICIDDNSEQNEYDIIKRYMEKDSRISYIRHEKNYGLGGARNTGIAHAHGDYIASIDSDDIAYEEMIETAYKATNNGEVDVVAFSFEVVDENGNMMYLSRLKQKEYRNEKFDIFNVVNPAFWNKLWKKELFDKIRFPPYVYYEDLATIPKLLYRAQTLTIIEEILYKYRQRSGSITNSMSGKHLADSIFVSSILFKFLYRENIFEETKISFYKRIMRHINYVVSCSKKLLKKSRYRQYLECLIIQKIGIMNGINKTVKKNEDIEKSILTDESTVFQLTEENRNLCAQISQLSTDKERLALEKESLSNEIKKICEEKEKLIKYNEEILSKTKKLSKDNAIQLQRVLSVEKENIEHKEKISNFVKEIEILREQNEDLIKRNKKILSSKDELSKSNEMLSQRLLNTDKEIILHKEKISKLNNKIKLLHEQKEELIKCKEEILFNVDKVTKDSETLAQRVLRAEKENINSIEKISNISKNLYTFYVQKETLLKCLEEAFADIENLLNDKKNLSQMMSHIINVRKKEIIKASKLLKENKKLQEKIKTFRKSLPYKIGRFFGLISKKYKI